MAKHLNTRAAAAKISWQIIDKGQSLDAAIASFFELHDYSPQDRGFVQELIYGVCRWYGELDAVANTLLKSPIRNKDRVVHFVLLVGLYQLRHLDTAEHAGVDETVSACKQLDKQWAKNVINGCLRNYLRAPDNSDLDGQAVNLSHPDWIKAAIKSAWPSHLDAILNANNQRPPMCLRVNRRQNSREEYLTMLKNVDISATPDPFSGDGIILDNPCAVSALPNFDEGACSVQDTAAQIAADLLLSEINIAESRELTILDACAAPGGKTAHLLERCDNAVKLDALDISERRCQQLYSTLDRLQLNADIYVADASKAPTWEPPQDGYDRILIDAPCSGLGVIRRHPDIKHHRRPSDIDTLELVQGAILDQLWSLLKPSGVLLYMTCSVLPKENEKQIIKFLKRTGDAQAIPAQHPSAQALEYGVQTLPGVHGMDGFYYCLLEKS
jgi:16S rRNA (cytosine967-C5)-methyltransferase